MQKALRLFRPEIFDRALAVRIEQTVSELTCCGVYKGIKALVAQGVPTVVIFNAFYSEYALSKIGHLTEKHDEAFNELYSLRPRKKPFNMIGGREVTLYRGMSDAAGAHGSSWTTSFNIAYWFAQRFASNEGDPVVESFSDSIALQVHSRESLPAQKMYIGSLGK